MKCYFGEPLPHDPMSPVLVFDLGGVVFRFCAHARLAALSRACGLHPDFVRQAVWGSEIDARAERGDLRPDNVVDAVLDALDRRVDRATLIDTWSKAFRPNGSLVAYIRDLPRPMFAFSNNGPLFSECLDKAFGEVASLFDRVVLSWEIAAVKPDPTAYRRLAATLDVAPEQAVVIDDSTANCRAARSVGFRAIRYRGPADLRRRLRTMTSRPDLS